MNNKISKTLLIGTTMLAAATSVFAVNPQSGGNTYVAVFGDSPYDNYYVYPDTGPEFNATPDFIDSINNDTDVSLVMHVGDIHSGKQYCTEAYDQAIYKLWKSFRYPVAYTPGDNEWTDCHKQKEGGGVYNSITEQIDYVLGANGKSVDYKYGNPVENLSLIREIFFNNPGKTLGAPMKVLSQSQAYDQNYPSDKNYVENVIWEQSGVLFVTLNIPGGSNNDSDPWYGAPITVSQTNEIAERTDADLRWLDKAFTQATADDAIAVVIQIQADMWDPDGKFDINGSPNHINNYMTFINSIAGYTSTFGKPVLLLNGDSHLYRSDNPMADNADCVIEDGNGTSVCTDDAYDYQSLGYNVPNFHRVVVHGSTAPLEWLKLTIDPGADGNGPTAFGPFSWERINTGLGN